MTKRAYRRTPGSPPQVRGKPLPLKPRSGLSRITPAGAGKTSFRTRTTSLVRDHPRRCGENFCHFSSSVSQLGSPPQVRGKPYQQRRNSAGVEDHPRRCGENRRLEVKIRKGTGSPPQVRGKPNYDEIPKAKSGITPAGAGKTSGGVFLFIRNRDHPRRCGENAIAADEPTTAQGSPPQVRGKHHRLPRDSHSH